MKNYFTKIWSNERAKHSFITTILWTIASMIAVALCYIFGGKWGESLAEFIFSMSE